MKSKHLILALILIFFLGAGASCNILRQNPSQNVNLGENNIPEQKSGQALSSVDPKELQSKLDDHLKEATSFASSWQGDVALYAVSVKIDPTLNKDKNTEIYIFGSSQNSDYWYTVSYVADQKSTRAAVFKEDYLPNLTSPVKKDFWKTNFVSVFQTAEKSGGKTFREQNPNFSISLLLSVSKPKDWLWWEVEYKTEGKDALKFRIDPDGGFVVNDNGDKI